MNDPAFPTYWGAEQAGMQSGGQLEGQDLEDAMLVFNDVYSYTLHRIQAYLENVKRQYGGKPEEYNPHTLHKSLLARLLEPFMWHTAIFAATDDGWENFFHQRATKRSGGAQPEFREMADACLECWETSTPAPMDYGEWHMPFLRPEDDHDLRLLEDESDRLAFKQMISVGRCARVSYLNHDGVRDWREDVNVYNKLISGDPVHWAPLEFVATPTAARDNGTFTLGNFKGWDQLRHRVESGAL